MKEFKVTIKLMKPDGSVVPFDSLTDEEVREVHKTWEDRCSRVMSRYYTEHPDEFEKLKEG